MSLSKDLVLLMLQFCAEENFKRTAHMLEQESGYFFDLEHFEELILHGNWDEAEDYLSSFTLLEDNKYSTKIYFEIRKQKFLEALDKHESAAALDILVKDLKVFEQSNKELYKEMTLLLTMPNFRHIRRLLYSHSGNGVVALAEDGTHLLWKWEKNDDNINGEASTKSTPALYQPKRGLLMINDTPPRNSSLDDQVPSTLTLSKNDAYVISSSGAVISLYDAISFKELRSVMRPPPAATCIVFYPPDNNVIAIGRHDASILIFNIRTDELISKLKGHSKRVTGLAFSTTLNVLVSCAVDTEIIVWDSRTWEKKKSTVLQISGGLLGSAELSETSIELDKDHNHFLAVHQTQLAIYETLTLRRVKQWTIANFCARISHATYSCDSEMVYAAMRDGIILVLDASDLSPRYEIDPSAYLPSRLRPCYVVGVVDPVVIAAHPKKKNQFALGLSNGEVVVVEPLFPTQVKLASSL
ncbi:hypothetical protein MIMGU_mgv1a005807mg [Erythranthe guttata]|uniref:CTLH domain-containing protein n=1 Tax=Erythranthe guttata TaxID=4155 RepID=A0A022PZB9_ERYGU|nr:hypothetical protein MIMGU_mgv1a005807mg [Erythranthe guttata]